MGALRLAWRLQRFELIVVLGACLALAAAGAIVALLLSGATGELAACYRTAPDSAVAGWPCLAIDGRVNQLSNVGTVLTGFGTVAPFLMGVFLGAPIVAREIEGRTASIAWSLGPSRTAWLARRTLPIAGIVAVALLVVGQANEAVLLATPPGEIDFRHFAMHGPLLAVRGLAVLGIGLVVGLVLGRSLPAILAAGLITAAVFGGLHFVRYELMRTEAVWVDPQQTGWSFTYIHESGFRFDATGQVMGFEEALQRYPEVFEDEQGDQVPPGTTMVYRVNPPEQYMSFVLREAGLLGALAAVLAGAAAWLIGLRRPD